MKSFADVVLLFSAYSLLGWLLETAYALYVEKGFVKRGFLYGCFCPIYGFGAMAALVSFRMAGGLYGQNTVASFLVGALLASTLFTVIEYTAGVALQRLFGRRYWDYSGIPTNIHGYVCLSYSLLWGVIGVLFVVFVHPAVAPVVTGLPVAAKNILAAALGCYFFADTALSAARARGVRPELPALLRSFYR